MSIIGQRLPAPRSMTARRLIACLAMLLLGCSRQPEITQIKTGLVPRPIAKPKDAPKPKAEFDSADLDSTRRWIGKTAATARRLAEKSQSTVETPKARTEFAREANETWNSLPAALSYHNGTQVLWRGVVREVGTAGVRVELASDGTTEDDGAAGWFRLEAFFLDESTAISDPGDSDRALRINRGIDEERLKDLKVGDPIGITGKIAFWELPGEAHGRQPTREAWVFLADARVPGYVPPPPRFSEMVDLSPSMRLASLDAGKRLVSRYQPATKLNKDLHDLAVAFHGTEVATAMKIVSIRDRLAVSGRTVLCGEITSDLAEIVTRIGWSSTFEDLEERYAGELAKPGADRAALVRNIIAVTVKARLDAAQADASGKTAANEARRRSEGEVAARKQLEASKVHRLNGDTTRARDGLNDVLANYPYAKAAIEARKILAELDGVKVKKK